MNHSDARFDPTSLREAKALRTARSQLDDCTRMIARQRVLLDEVGADSAASVELQRSLIRLEAVRDTSRAALSALQLADEARGQAGGGGRGVAPTEALPGSE